jgi:hypothetical protein
MDEFLETDTYADFRKNSAANGGLRIAALLDSGTQALLIDAIGVTDNADKNSGANAYCMFQIGKKSGTSTANAGANANLLGIAAIDGTRLFLFDQEGEGHAEVGWSTYAQHDDLALIAGIETELLAVESEAQTSRRRMLEEVGIIGKDSWRMADGKPKAMVNFTRLAMLHHGALIQVSERIEVLETNLLALQEAN